MLEEEKTLVLHTLGSTFKFGPLYKRYFWDINMDGTLEILEIKEGKEKTVAIFNKWDYFLIE